LRILVCTRHAQALGGAETYLRTVVPTLLARGHDVRVGVELASPKAEIDWTVAVGIQAAQLSNPAGVASLVQEFAPQVIFNHQVADFEVERALVDTNCAVLFLHSYHGLCISGRRMHSFPRPTPCSRNFGPACLALYFPRRCGGLDPVKALELFVLQTRRLRQFPRYRRIVVPSDHFRSLLLESGVDERKVCVVPHFTGPASFGANRVVTPGQELIVLLLGRLTEEKGCLLVPAALREASRLTGRRILLWIAGEGPLRVELQRKLRAERIEFGFFGWVDSRERQELLSKANLLLFPSIWLEPFGLVGIEAASYGVPAVAFPHGGVKEWLIPGSTGEVANSGIPTSEGLARAVARAIATPEHLSALARAAYDNAARFRAERHISALERAFQDSVVTA
jgi:glycosyltransferase involved in cell wall biosynthesis